jgi:NAD+ kinase
MTIARAGLLAKPNLLPALEALTEAAAWLKRHGCEPVIDQATASGAGLTIYATETRESLAEGVDVMVAFGGDGTFLDAASAVAHSAADTPVLGVNLGHLGFLTEVGRADLVPALEALLAGQTRTETRAMLSGRVARGDVTVAERIALNDVVITRGAWSAMIEVDVDVDGHSVCQVKADGIIVSTATGSTAYNLSAGGPIVHPMVDAFVLTPIAPHTLTNRPLILPADAGITLRPLQDALPDAAVTFDGQSGVALEAGDVVHVRQAAQRLSLLRISPRTHFDMLREKLKWHG